MSRKLIRLDEAAKLLWFTREQFLAKLEHIPFPVEIRDGVAVWDRDEILAWRRNGCPRLQWWYSGKPPSMISRIQKLLAELADQPFTGGAAQ